MSELERARERAWKQLQQARARFARGRLEEYVLSRAERRYAALYPGPSARRKRGK